MLGESDVQRVCSRHVVTVRPRRSDQRAQSDLAEMPSSEPFDGRLGTLEDELPEMTCR